jgi:purine/pyrimidine-nucleoside phosphorylase
MVQVNEYFNGNVKSLTLEASGNKATVGVMKAGEYEFSTGLKEIMTVVAGAMAVKLPGAADFKIFSAGEKFEVAANSIFQLKISGDAAYLCEFIA